MNSRIWLMMRARLRKTSLHLRIYYKIHIALPISGFHIGKSVEFFRQRQQRLGQKADFLDMKRQFPGFSSEREAFRADNIPDIKRFKNSECFFTNRIFLNI